MGEIVNLRMARKAKARDEKDAAAATNRVKHGRTKAEKTLQKSQVEAMTKQLDGHKLQGKETP